MTFRILQIFYSDPRKKGRHTNNSIQQEAKGIPSHTVAP